MINEKAGSLSGGKNCTCCAKNTTNAKPLPLEIFLVTYNRKEFLKKTLENIFANDSPIKNLSITILDNCSTDGSSELIRSYLARWPNLKQYRHKKNIGGNANICRAFELAVEKYCWILCDDDCYSWKGWQEVEQAIRANYDAILVSQTGKISTTIEDNYKINSQILNEMSFLPATIFKTANINEDVLQAAYANISNSFPHLALACYLFNNKKSCYVVKNPVVIQGWILKTNSTVNMNRGIDTFVHYRFQNPNIFTFYVNSFQMLCDKKLKYQSCSKIFTGYPFFFAILLFYVEGRFSKYNTMDIFLGISWYQKIIFIVATMVYFVCICPVRLILGNTFEKFMGALRQWKRTKENKC